MNKTIAFSLVAALLAGPALAASPVASNGAFSIPVIQPEGNYVKLDQVRAPADGVLEIYDYNNHEIGGLLGSEVLTAGVNRDVRITLRTTPFNDALAVVKVDGQIVDQQTVRFSR